MQRRLGAARPSTGRGRYFSIRKPNRRPNRPCIGWLPVTDIASLPMTDRLTRLAELSVHGANVQKGQIVLVGAEIGLEEQARATAAAAYKRGAKFVDVAYFDPYVKRVRIESADPDTLLFVPQWYGERVLEHAEQNGARINLRGVTAPNLMDGLDKSLLGKDMLRRALDQLVLRPGAASGVGDSRPSRPAGGRGVRAALARARVRAAPRRARPGRRLGRAHGGAERLRRAAGRAPLRRARTARPRNRGDDRPAADRDLDDCRLLDRERLAASPEPPERGGLHDAGPPTHERARHRDEAARPPRRDEHPR